MATTVQGITFDNNQGVNRRLKDVTHPEYNSMSLNWLRWRVCYSGGRPFVYQFLEQWSREGSRAFSRRRNMTPSPSFAKAAINEISNAVFQRLADVERLGGSDSYRKAINGEAGGVDLKSASMAAFIGRYVLPELLIQGRVGIWVDNSYLPESPTLAAVGNKHPYLYAYRAEDIRNWVYLEGPRQGEFQSILLCDATYTLDDNTQLPTTKVENYRHAYLDPTDGKCHVVTETYAGARGEQILDVPKIPFIMLELPQSLMKDIDGYQIALLNIVSANVMFATQHNYPFYVEMYDHRVGSPYTRGAQQGDKRVANNLATGQPAPPSTTVSPDGQFLVTPAGQAAQAGQAKPEEIVLGTGAARRYPMGTERPAFIHPSSEPMKAALELEESFKRSIRELVLLSVSSLSPTLASAESKDHDWRALENGLSFIGLILEQGERQVAERWAMYEKGTEPANVAYPDVWSMLSEEDRRAEADQLKKQLGTVPSQKYRIQVCKQVVRLLVGHRIPRNVLEDIYAEIKEAGGLAADWESVIQDLENGLVSAEFASKLRGYPGGEVEKAAEEHAERIARIQAAQGRDLGAPNAPNRDKGTGVGGEDPGARGVTDLSADPKAGAKERAKDRLKRGKGAKPNDQKGD